MMHIIQQRKYAYAFSIVITVLSMAALGVWGLRLGIDFKGGTLLEVQFAVDPTPEVKQLTDALAPIGLQSLTVQPTENRAVLLRYLSSDEHANDQVLEKLREVDSEVKQLRTNFIGGSVSGQMKQNALTGVALAVIGIALYIAWAFRRVSAPVTSWEYGLGAVLALGHDILVTLGVFAVLGKYYGIEVGVPFIAALLTILGYSVNDTIVVYDRIRENLLREHGKTDFEATVNRSLNQTLGRSINTSMTVIITLLAITIFGGESIRYFSLAILIGVTFGTYSSVYIASALLVSRYKMKLKK
jgi:preprotein translocase subunit SecF